MADVCRAMREQIQLAHEIPFEMQNRFLKAVDLLEMPPSALTVVLTQEPSPKFEANTAMILWPWHWLGFHKNKRIKALPTAHAGTPKVEIELPEKMAAGFMCALAGALITIIPGGQAVDLTLIGTGLAITLDGMAEGERPFHTSAQDPFKPQ